VRGEAEVDHGVILGLLLALAALAWAVLVWQHANASMDMTTASVTMGPRVPLFLATWVVMMVAMMLPTALPMILTFPSIFALQI
jgi:predicted metal-binding membrane protein